jgi:SOS-response transcriptional repressor LexA
MSLNPGIKYTSTLSPFLKATVYAIINDKIKWTQRAVGRKIAEGTNRSFKIEGDKIYYYKKESNRSTDLYVDQNITDSERNIISKLGYNADTAQKLHRVPLLSGLPNINELKHLNDMPKERDVITTHQGRDMFALKMPDSSMEPIVKKDSTVICDPSAPLQNGDIAAFRHQGKTSIRKYYDKQNTILFQAASPDTPPELHQQNDLEICVKAVEVIMKL